MDNLSVIASLGAASSRGTHSPEEKSSRESIKAGSISPMVVADGGRDVLAGQCLDPVLEEKIALVNNAIDEIGWTPYHTKLFFLNGFG